MRKYFIELENDHSAPVGTPGHGFSGFLDITVNTPEALHNQSQAQTVLKALANVTGQSCSDIFDLIERDLNNDSPTRDN